MSAAIAIYGLNVVYYAISQGEFFLALEGAQT
jgi:hypothetical protein